jgi:hypothetical protein
MALAGTETEGDQDGKQGETFHRAPLSRFPVIGNPVSPPKCTFSRMEFIDALRPDSSHIRRCRRARRPETHVRHPYTARH